MKPYVLAIILSLAAINTAHAQSCCESADRRQYEAAEADREQQQAQEAQRAEQDREAQERAEQQVQADAERERTESEIRQSQGGY